MFGNSRPSPEQSLALQRIETWTRERFSLAPAEAVLVSELACALPGCPPLETVVAFWTAGATDEPLRHHMKVFKPALQVTPDDLPPYWMKPALAADDAGDCC